MANKANTVAKRSAKAEKSDLELGRYEKATVRPARLQAEQPEPEWVRGSCPECGASLVSNMYYVGGKGYLIVWECWRSLNENPKCTYRRVL